MPKRLLWLVLPVVAVSVPPVVYNAKDWWSQAKQRVTPLLALGTGAEIAATTEGAPAAPRPLADPAGSALSSAGSTLAPPGSARRAGEPPARVDLAEVLRFDVSPDWVMQRWPWISAGLSQLPLQGYRVPLVTGTAVDDVAGSLTYYFNAKQKVEQITLEGTTGDASQLLRILVGRYRFGRRLTNDPGLFRYEVPELRGPAKSFLDIRITQPNDAYRRYQVELVLMRPE
jgi:hypothetical protein